MEYSEKSELPILSTVGMTVEDQGLTFERSCQRAETALALLQIDARVLPAPTLEYATPQPPPSGGAWNLRNMRFMQGASLKAYAVISFALEESVGGRNDPRGLPVSHTLQHCSKMSRFVGCFSPYSPASSAPCL